MKKISKYRSALMGIFIIWIYVFHTADIFRYGTVTQFIISLGHSAVDMFVILSGYGMVYALKSNPVNDVRSYFRFEAKRFARIYAGFLPATALIAIVNNWTKVMILGRITFVEQFSKNLYIHLWYIALILILYLFVPFYYALFSKSKNKMRFTVIFIIITIIIGCISRCVFSRDDIVSAVIPRIPMFAIGIYWGYSSLFEPDSWQGPRAIRLRVILYVLLIPGAMLNYMSLMELDPVIPGIDRFLTSWIIFHYSRLLFNPALIMLFADMASIIDQCKPGKAVNKAFAYIGGITLEIYCLHEWVFRRCSDLQTSIDEIRWKLTAVLVTFLLSVGIHKVANDLVLKHLKKAEYKE